jgi:diguanylate cyclase (GGDEF)-like protein
MEGARQFANRVRESLARHELPTGARITVSAGIAVSGPTMNNPAELVRAADTALYQAKAAGRNRVEPGSARSEGAPARDNG